MDNGFHLVEYSDQYWKSELPSARERGFGSNIARAAEVFMYARREISAFVDIGAGPGFFSEAIRGLLPEISDLFWGVEKFPPPNNIRPLPDKQFVVGGISDMPIDYIDAGICVEVIEHLTPKMVFNLFKELAIKSRNDSCFLFNTGLPKYVKEEDRGYMDPLGRGHVLSWSVSGLNHLIRELGFQAIPLPGKTWAMIVEYRPTEKLELTTRIWKPIPATMNRLAGSKYGNLFRILGTESYRAYADY